MLKVDVDVAEIMKTFGSWVGSVVSHDRARTDQKIKNAIPALATKLSVLAGLNLSFAASLSQPIRGDADIKLLNAQLDLLKRKIKEIVDLLESADPQFGSTHPQLMTLLAATIDEKVGLLQ